MTQEIEIIIDEPIVLTIGAQQVLPDSIVLDENYVHTDNNYTDADKNKVANALTSETDPTVPAWAKQPTKPSYSKSEIGLGNVDNTSDLSKPISTATQSALNAKQDTLFSGTNIKTINNNSILGGGNLNIPSGINLTDLSATSPIQYDNVTGVMSIPAASTSTDGYLSTADWNSFNDKENKQTLTFINATTSTAAATVAKVATVNGSYVPQSGDVILLTLTQSNTASNPTLNIDGSGNKSILLGNQNPSNIAMLGTKVLLWYDGAAYQLFGSQRNIDTDTNTTYTGWGFTPTAITANTTGTVNRGYVANSASRIILTLPTTFAIGDVIGITGLGTGGFQLKAGSGDTILFDGNSITSAGYINGGQYDTVYIMGITANTTWQVVNYGGSLTDSLGNTYTNTNVPVTGAASTIITNYLTANRALISDGSGKVGASAVTNTELSYLSGATSAIQTQINNKLNSSAVSLSAGQVGFGSGSNTIGGDNGLYWDNTNKRFAVGTTTPTEKLHVVGNGLFTGTLKIGAYTLPNTDGTANQMLRTNGSGVVSWQNSYPIEVINSSNLFSRGLSGTGSGVTSADYSIFFGESAGASATNANKSNFFGASAGYDATDANNSNFFGASAGRSATGAYYSNFFGASAGYDATDAYYSNLFGYQVGKTFSGNNIGGNNIIIGTNISLGDAVANSMNIGGVLFGTGFNSDTSGDPKIAPVAGGMVGVGEVAPKERLEVDGVVLSRYKTMSADPTTSDIASGYFMVVKSVSTGKLHLWANDGGTMKKIEFT